MARKLFQRLDESLLKKDSDRAAQRAAEAKAYGSAKSKPFSKNSKPQMWVVLADLHYPESDRPSVAAAMDFVQKNKKNIGGVVLLGDFLDCASISRHTENLPGLRQKGGFQTDIDGFLRDIIDPIDAALPKAQKVLLLGNHENWLSLLLDKQPELAGALSWPKLLQVKERGWTLVGQGNSFSIGKLLLIHGDQVGSGANVAKKLVDTHCANVLMGHCHTFSAHTKTSEVKVTSKWVGMVIPCLTTLSPSYGKARPNSHLRGFAIVESFEGGRLFNVFVPIISEGKFCFSGQVYGR